MSSHPAAIGRYEIVRQIGQGGMGRVLLAWDPMLERQVCLKILHDVESRELRGRFTREARSAARLKHPNIVTIFDVGEDNGAPFLAMEYIQGKTLEEIIRTDERLSLVRTLQVMEDVCAGLGFAHKSGIVHRDIKPANLMLDAEGGLQILDFGIVHVEGSGMTQSGMLMGTFSYMSPEQLSGRGIDQRSDLFAVGAVFYELLVRKPAFPGTFHDGLFQKIVNEDPEPIETLRPGLPADVIAIVRRALEKSPDDRYPDAAAMRGDIQRIRRRLEDEDARAGATVIGEATNISGYRDLARQALERGDYEQVIAACEDVLHRNPDDSGAAEMLDQARQAIDRQQAGQWLAEARDLFGRDDLSGAASLLDQVMTIAPGSESAVALRQQIDAARAATRGGTRVTNAPVSSKPDARPAVPGTVLSPMPAAPPSPTAPQAGAIPATPRAEPAGSSAPKSRLIFAGAAAAVVAAAVGFYAIGARFAAESSATSADPAAGTVPPSAPGGTVAAIANPSQPTTPDPSLVAPAARSTSGTASVSPTTPAAARPIATSTTKPTPAAAAAVTPSKPEPVSSVPTSMPPGVPASLPPAPPVVQQSAAPPPPPPSVPPTPPAPRIEPAPATVPPVEAAIPPAAEPPPKPAPEPPKPAVIDEEAAIRTTLRAYERAFSSLDAQAVKRVWPAVNADELARAFADMRGLTLAIRNERIKVNGGAATVECTIAQSITPKVGSRQDVSNDVRLQLQKGDAGWIIVRRQ